MEILKLILCGAVVGVANIIPGVSGGTMAVVLNLYDQLIESVSGVFRHFWKSMKFLVPFMAGAGAGIVALSKLIEVLLEKQYMAVNFFFIGVVLGSIPLLWCKMIYTDDSKEAKIKVKAGHIVSAAIPFLLMAGMAVGMMIIGEGNGDVMYAALTVKSFVVLLFSLMLAAFCMIIPGLSGSFIMVLLGVYPSIIGAISDMNILLLIPAVIGAAIGILFGAKIIDRVLARFPNHSFFAIMGFVLGSIPVLLCKIGQADAYRGGLTLAVSVLVLIGGAALSYFGAKVGEKNEK